MKTTASRPSDLVSTALALDQEFGRFERLADELDRLDVETENGLAQAAKVLGHFSDAGEKIGVNIEALAETLGQARARAEKAAERVAVRAERVRQRREESDRIHERFRLLGEMVHKVSSALGDLQRARKDGRFTDQEFKSIAGSLPEIGTNLSVLAEEARKVEAEAQAANLKSLVKEADSMAQSLVSAKSKLQVFSDGAASLVAGH